MIYMKKLTPNFIALSILIMIAFFYFQHASDELNYWKFISHHMVLNIGLASAAIAAGFLVKNYLLIILGAIFVLVIYCMALVFSPGAGMMIQFFFAIFTVFLAFSVIANICRHFRDWLLAEKMYA